MNRRAKNDSQPLRSIRDAIIGWAVISAIGMPLEAADETKEPIIRIGSRPEQVMFTKITVTDLRKSYDFYTRVLGFKEIKFEGIPVPELDDPNIKFAEVVLNDSGSPVDAYIVLLKTAAAVPERNQAKLTTLAFKVRDVRTVVSRAKASGVEIEMEPTRILGMTVGILRDLDGYTVQLHEAQSVVPATNSK